jgi:glycosyltransferase involved in cell wall biosynthesis
MKVVLLTAGAAGMYCGSCMHDNALARALRGRGVDCLLQPVYTPIRTDELSIADKQVFFGGIHIYLLQQLPWLAKLPAVLRRPLDWPPLIRFATRRVASTDAAKLGALSVSMLQGAQGRQADEVQRLVDWLDDMKPDALVFSNLLIAGALPELRRRLPDTKIAVVLQGDDIFLDHLPEPSRTQVLELCRRLVGHVDHFIANSRFYADKMGELFAVPSEKLFVAPLSIDLAPFQQTHAEVAKPAGEFRLGYLARIAPEKGLHHLVDAFLNMAAQPEHQDLTLHVAGWLGEANRQYLNSLTSKIDAANLTDRFTYHGSPDLAEKISLLRSWDVMSVPTDYQEPKGLFVLESLAAGVPVVQPDHGAFGELIASTGGGLLVPPGDVDALCRAIAELKADPSRREQLGREGLANVQQKHSIDLAAEQLQQLLLQ